MKYHWHGRCPKCQKVGWHDYKGKAYILTDGSETLTYRVSIFKCSNCKKKFGFEGLENTYQEPKIENELYEKEGEDDSIDWKTVHDLLDIVVNHTQVPNKYLNSALTIATKHCGRDS